MLPPGLYGMEIVEHKNRAGDVEYEVQFHERRLEEVVKRLNRLERQDEKPFEAVAALSEFNQRAYELFAQPFVQALGNEATAKLSRQFHRVEPTSEQLAMIENIGESLDVTPARGRVRTPTISA